MKIDPNYSFDSSYYQAQANQTAVSSTKQAESIDTISSFKKEKEAEVSNAKKATFLWGLFDWVKDLFSSSNKETDSSEEISGVDSKTQAYPIESVEKVVGEMKEVNRRTKDLDDEFDALQNQANFEALLKRLQELHEDKNPHRAIAILLKMLVLLQNGQSELKERDNFFLMDEVQRKQGGLKALQEQKLKLSEEIGKIQDRTKIFNKIDVALTTAGYVITVAGIASAVGSLVTAGISGIISIAIQAVGGVVTGLKAVNTLIHGLTQEDLKKIEAKSLEATKSRELEQYSLKVNIQDVEKNMKDITRFNEALAEILRAEYEAGNLFR